MPSQDVRIFEMNKLAKMKIKASRGFRMHRKLEIKPASAALVKIMIPYQSRSRLVQEHREAASFCLATHPVTLHLLYLHLDTFGGWKIQQSKQFRRHFLYSNLWAPVRRCRTLSGKGREIVEILREPETSMKIADTIAIMKGTLDALQLPCFTAFYCIFEACQQVSVPRILESKT